MFTNVNENLYPLGCGFESCKVVKAGCDLTQPLDSEFIGHFDFIDTDITTTPNW